MLKFSYAKTEQSYLEILGSSFKLFLCALPNCLLSIVLIAVCMLCSIITSNLYYIKFTINFLIYAITLNIIFIQIQSYADGYRNTLTDLLNILQKKLPKVLLIQSISYLITIGLLYISVLLMPIIIFPLTILTPIALFKTDSLGATLKTACRVVSGNKIMMLYSIFLCAGCAMLIKTLILYLTGLYFTKDWYLSILFLIINLSIFYYASSILVILHNILLRNTTR